MDKLIPKFWILTLMIFAAAFVRLLPHPPNFAPIAAMALFGGAYFNKKWAAFLVPLVAMFIYRFNPRISRNDVVSLFKLCTYSCDWYDDVEGAKDREHLFRICYFFGKFLYHYELWNMDFN